MTRYFIRDSKFSYLLTILSFFVFIFFISHIFFGDRSVWRIFVLNNKISVLEEEYKNLLSNKNKILLEIGLLRDDNLDADFISEISNKNLGLIQADQIVLDIKN